MRLCLEHGFYFQKVLCDDHFIVIGKGGERSGEKGALVLGRTEDMNKEDE